MNTKRAVNQYDLDGNYIRTFDSVYKAEKACGKYNHTIYHCLRGEIKSAFGYLWRYEKDSPAGERLILSIGARHAVRLLRNILLLESISLDMTP